MLLQPRHVEVVVQFRIDRELLSKQKDTLVRLASTATPEQQEHIDGVLSVLDSISDAIDDA